MDRKQVWPPEEVTTPYCSGLSLLLSVQRPGRRWLACNHPLLFGTVSPTEPPGRLVALRPLVTTPYCSGLSLLLASQHGSLVFNILVTTPYCSGLSLLLVYFLRALMPYSGNHPLLFGTVSPTEEGWKVMAIQRTVTTPYCSGLSLLLCSSRPSPSAVVRNHPLLFGTVSPTQ